MALVSAIIASARYDLLDELSTQYTDAMLLDFLNRGLRPLCVVLSLLRSDWVNATSDLTLSAAASEASLPTNFISEITVRIGTNEKDKKSVSAIRKLILSSTAGEPSFFAIQGSLVIFEKAADQEYTVTMEFSQGVDEVALGDSMPFSDEFNDVLKQFIILLGKSRNNYDLRGDAAVQDFFYQAVFSKIVARNHVPNLHKTGY